MSEQLEVVQRAVGAFNARNIEGYMELYDRRWSCTGMRPSRSGSTRRRNSTGA